ncbi:hypothetical protein CHS0354_035106 [Potamilus streckersoni]|uniref:Uncharacterized protein n=1 Tax=Potamilus streckersoni TaxID=2493646 RepID=A0AAE0RU08_9BIVA|nr:hypothetical protein CHS0354_035106 [Potamilus streckersoni]
MWLKEDACIARVKNGIFTPCESYKGRAELFNTFGISLHNISRHDSGHYNVVILLNGSFREYLPCQSTYLPGDSKSLAALGSICEPDCG